jgi:putative resolvase
MGTGFLVLARSTSKLPLVASGRKIIVVNPEEMKDDLVQDMYDVLTSFCTRLYGRRLAKNRAAKAIEAAKC